MVAVQVVATEEVVTVVVVRVVAMEVVALLEVDTVVVAMVAMVEVTAAHRVVATVVEVVMVEEEVNRIFKLCLVSYLLVLTVTVIVIY